MDTTSKRNAAVAVTINGFEMDLAFANGEHIAFNAETFGKDVWNRAVMHGLKQKLVDAAAIARNPDTGKSATIDDKYQAVLTVYERLAAGQWNAVREGGAGNVGGLLLRALVRMYEGRKTVDDLKAFLDGKTDVEKAALRKNPKVAAIIETIKAERMADEGIDTDELLGELDD